MSNGIHNNSKIVEFFRNSTILLTGGTGFLGKVLTVKLLQTCQVSRIYLLIRKNKSKTSTDRMRELFQDPIFLKLREELPDYEERIKCVEGNFINQNLGISATDEETLCESVNFIVNCAAAMNMLGSFKNSVTINIRGTQQLVALANKMPNLKAFVHLSTLSAFWENETIEEKLYKTHLEYEDCLQLLILDNVLSMEKQNLDKIVGNKQTIYSLTKAASENIFLRENISVPVVIFRVALAISCWKEPIPGWSPRFWGPNGLLLLTFLEVTPALYWNGSPSSIIDVTPGDLVANAIIAATSYSFDRFQKSKDDHEELSPFVYNYTSMNNKNALTYEDTLTYIKKEFYKTPSLYSSKIVHILYTIFLGYFPPLVLDNVAFLLGKRYTHLKTRINDENVQNCWKSLSNTDKKLFSFDLNDVVWNQYVPPACNSVREFIHNLLEKYESLRLAVFWLPIMRYGLMAIYSILVLYFVSYIFCGTRRIF